MEDEYEGKGKYYPTAVLTNKKLLLDNSLCELSIKIGNETVLAHAAIVASRCEEILPFVQDAKSQKKKKHEVKLKDGIVKNAAVMNKILEFIYTGTLEFAKLTNEEILFVNGGARNLNLVRLVYLCEKFLRDNLSMENLFHLLKAATDLNEQRVKAFCLCYALDHYNDFITNKDGIKILGIELFQEVVAAFQGSKPVVEEKAVPQDQYLDDFRRLYEHMPYSDFHFALDGEQIKCHKAILIAHSDQFNNILKVENAIQQDRVSAKAVRSMLKYLYYGDEDIEQSAAVELVPFARRYKLHALLRVCEDKIRINLSTDTILDVLSVAYMPSEKQDLIEEIKSKSFPFIIENLTQINLQTLRMQHPMMAIDLLFRLQDSSKKGEIKLSGLVSGYTPPVNEPASHKHSNNNNNNNNNNNSNNNNNNSNNISIQNSSSNSNLSSSGGSFPPSPKSSDNNNNSNFPPPLLSQRPPPPPRSSVSQNSGNFPPPPVLGTPSPNSASSGSVSARGENPTPDPVDSEASGKTKVKKTLSQKDLKSELKQSTSSKKEEEKKKKEEAKRLAKEKKERQKMEKKFKGH